MLSSLLSFPALITIIGAVLLGYGTLRKSRRAALLTLGGFLAIVASFPIHLSVAHSFFVGSGSFFVSTGVGLVLLSLVATRNSQHEKGRRQFLVLATAALVVGLALRVLGVAFGANDAEVGNANIEQIESEEASGISILQNADDLDGSAQEVSESILVELGPDDTIDEILPLIEEYGGSAERAFPSLSLEQDEDLAQVFIVSGIKKDLLLKFIDFLRKQIEDVDNVEINVTIELDDPIGSDGEYSAATGLLANDPLADQQWSMQVARVDAAHALLADIKPVRKAIVAILDTGVDARHEDISPTFLSESPATTDAHGHGTHCAGIAGASTNNGKGMASLNWEGAFVEISSYAALGASGMGTVETMAQAIIDATTDGADVISMSLGEFSLFPVKVVTDAVMFAQERGVIVIAAAGNSNQDAKMHIPSNIDGVIAVSAVDEKNRKASFSNTNMSLARPIAAPGVNIMSLEPNGKYGKKSGTSMATPLVAGLVGVMRAINPELTAEQIYKILEGTGKAGVDSKRVGNTIQSDAAIRVAAGNIVVRS